MATQAHCAYCFESLAASFDHRQPLSLGQVEDLWEEYHSASVDDTTNQDPQPENVDNGDDNNDEDEEMTDAETEPESTARPAAISRLLNSQHQSASSSSTSLPSTGTRSSKSNDVSDASGTTTPASSNASSSSKSSLFSFGRKKQVSKNKKTKQSHPLFVTWNTVSKSGYKSLRGCIGTFDAQELEYGLHSYALTSAFEDTRFHPIPAHQFPQLACNVTLLTNFSTPSPSPMDWTLGKHGIRISFSYHGRRYGATYLPDVAKEQGWTKEETMVSLMRKAGWNGSSAGWQKTWEQGKGELVTYEGKKVELSYAAWRDWRDWVDKSGAKKPALN